MSGTRATGVRFTTPSGAEVTGEPRARARHASSASVEADAVSALRSLELDAREAKRLVERSASALRERGEGPSVEALLREAFALLPTPGVRASSA